MVHLHRSALASALLFGVSHAAILSTSTQTAFVASGSSADKSTVTPAPIPLTPGAIPAKAAHGDVLKLKKRQTLRATPEQMEQACGVNYVACDLRYCCSAGQHCSQAFVGGVWECHWDSPGGNTRSNLFTNEFYSFDADGFQKSYSSLIKSMYSSMFNDPLYSSILNTNYLSSLLNDPIYSSIFANSGGNNGAALTSALDNLTKNLATNTRALSGGPTRAPPSSNNGNFSEDESSGGLSGAAIGGIVGGVIVVIIAALLTFFCMRRSKKKSKPTPPMVQQSPPNAGYYAKPPRQDPSKVNPPFTRPTSTIPSPPPVYQQPPQFHPPPPNVVETEAIPWTAGIAAHQAAQQQAAANQQYLSSYPTHAVETEARPWAGPSQNGTLSSSNGVSLMTPVSPNLSAVGTNTHSGVSPNLSPQYVQGGPGVSPNLPPQHVPPPPPGPPPGQPGYVPYQQAPIYEMPGRPEERSAPQ